MRDEGCGEIVDQTIAQPINESKAASIFSFPPRPSDFLSAWFSGCPRDQLLELRALRVPDGVPSQEFFAMDAIGELLGRAFSLVETHNCYFGVCPRVRPRGTKADVTHAPGLWTDLDFKGFEDGEAGALRTLSEFQLPPTWILGTGGGYHCYWTLRAPARADAHFERRLKALATILRADLAATDTARVLRVPGTWNHKRDFQVKVLSWPT